MIRPVPPQMGHVRFQPLEGHVRGLVFHGATPDGRGGQGEHVPRLHDVLRATAPRAQPRGQAPERRRDAMPPEVQLQVAAQGLCLTPGSRGGRCLRPVLFALEDVLDRVGARDHLTPQVPPGAGSPTSKGRWRQCARATPGGRGNRAGPAWHDTASARKHRRRCHQKARTSSGWMSPWRNQAPTRGSDWNSPLNKSIDLII